MSLAEGGLKYQLYPIYQKIPELGHVFNFVDQFIRGRWF